MVITIGEYAVYHARAPAARQSAVEPLSPPGNCSYDPNFWGAEASACQGTDTDGPDKRHDRGEARLPFSGSHERSVNRDLQVCTSDSELEACLRSKTPRLCELRILALLSLHQLEYRL